MIRTTHSSGYYTALFIYSQGILTKPHFWGNWSGLPAVSNKLLTKPIFLSIELFYFLIYIFLAYAKR
ncbi:hypothetical protein ACNGWZ_001784 [Campylobacter jejuni]